MLTGPDRTGDKGLSQARDPSTCVLSSPCRLPTIQMCFQPWLPPSAAQSDRFCPARTQPTSKLLLNSPLEARAAQGPQPWGFYTHAQERLKLMAQLG